MDDVAALTLHNAAVAQPSVAAAAVLLADYGIFVLPVALVAAWFIGGTSQYVRRRTVVAGVVAGAVAYCLGLLLEHTLARPRPFVALGISPLVLHAADSSFPSDHTLVGVAVVGLLALRAPHVGLWLLAWALLVGVARVTAGLHYPSDILGSAVLALALDAIAWWILQRLQSSSARVRQAMRLLY